MSADPVVPEAQSHKGLSRYAYVYNNPVRFDDPDGHVPNDRSREVRTYDEALEDYSNQQLAGLGYAGSGEEAREVQGGLARLGQFAAFGTREALRLHNAPLNNPAENLLAHFNLLGRPPGKYARIILAMEVEHHSYMLPSLLEEKNRRLLFHFADLHDVIDEDIFYEGSRRAAYLEGRRAGFRAGMSQTPILFSEAFTSISSGLMHGFEKGYKIPEKLAVGGGVLGVLSSVQYDNEYAKTLGVTGGLLEIIAGVGMRRNARIIGMSMKMSARTAATFRLLTMRTLGFAAGLVGLAALGIEYAYSQGYYDDPEIPPSVIRQQAEESDISFDVKDWKGDQLEPCKGNYCLAEGTLVGTSSGFKKIEEIEVGDFVLSPEGQAKVILTSKNDASSWLQIETSQETLKLTWGHPVKVEGRGWILAGEVEVGDYFLEGLEVLSIQEIQAPVRVYNLQVEPLNEFYVGESRILVKGLSH